MIARIKDMRTIYVTGWRIRFRQSVLSALCVVLCSCGNLFSSMSEAGLEQSVQIASLRADPLRNEYAITAAENGRSTNIFTPATDLTVLALYPNGTMREIPIEEVTIAQLDGAGEAGDLIEEPLYFTTAADLGEWCFEVSYGGKSALFAFYVRTKLEDPVVSEPDNGSGVDIGIKWKD
jgi:hypothetical protein